ncbi:RNA polymerase sigma factor sigX [Solibacillus isronensis B3W22]|uniref:RNA polymerase sigma factor n=1 Tax=Solibacillus isronensis B3W22 TaxID=1224748 RepID=K1L2R7_9BACL|nr:RNA polymerase sigma factor [Solibacillus isronensis]AMO85733.1 RNA polymerase subunit sigma-24 [Solibacillus silvestris]EKB46382.1 RNA polymerase sigma factor sigX [Solibacillus isronensis B3W22]
MNQEELTKWFEEYGDPILTYILLIVKDYQHAEDLTQETFIKAYKKQHEFEHKSTVKTWLFSIAFNVVNDYFRKKHPLQHYLDITSTEKDYHPIPEQIVVMNDQTEQLYRTIQQLKPTYRHVIILRKIKEFSTEEASMVLNWSESKVKMTLKRALAQLKKELLKGGLTYDTLFR